MNTTRQIFSRFLGPQAGEEVRRMFTPATLRACLDAAPEGDTTAANFANEADLATLRGITYDRLESIRNGYRRLAETIATDKANAHALFVKAALESAAITMASTRSRPWLASLVLPASIGPPETKITGMLRRNEAISMPGVILSDRKSVV